MKLLIVIPHMMTGGAQRLLSDLTPLMARRDDLDISFAVYADPENSMMWKFIRNNPRIRCHVLNIPISDLANLNPFIRSKAIKALKPLLKEADVCHVHLFPALYDAAAASRGLKTKLIFTNHSTFNRRRKYPLLTAMEKRIYARYSDIICISPACARSLTDWLAISPTDRRIHIIRNGININRFSFTDPCAAEGDLTQDRDEAAASELLERYETFVSGGDIHREERMKKAGIKSVADVYGRQGHPILMISRFVKSKDQKSLIRALALLKHSRHMKNMIPEDTFVAFVGDGPERGNAEKLAKEQGVANDVEFLGERSDIPNLIAAASAGAQISNWEGFGLTACEILASGLPLIASDVPGLADTIRGGARLVPKSSPEEIATAIIDVLGPESPEIYDLTQTLRSEGIRIAGRHDIRHTLRDYLKLYEL